MINGILNIYKEKGYTSHDVVARLRKIVGQKKIGHTGTLDPDAEGVLPVCLGRATRLCDMLTEHDKTYRTVLLLGRSTDTQDISGKVLEEHDAAHVTPEEAEKCVMDFVGDYDQVPPMYSALKINGKKLYELAREGKTVERKSRRVTIYDIQITDINIPEISMEVSCSKGTYIRTLCQDIGDRLGVGGCMKTLLRTRVGRFDIGGSVRLDEVEEKVHRGSLNEILIPLDAVFADLDRAVISDLYASLAYNGNPVFEKNLQEIPEGMPGSRCRLYDSKGRFIGIYQYRGSGRYSLEKMFLDPDELKIQGERAE